MRPPDGNRIRLYAAVAGALRSQRDAAGLSLTKLAAKSGIATAQLAKIEEGQACPLHVLVALADVYDTTLDDLVPVLV